MRLHYAYRPLKVRPNITGDLNWTCLLHLTTVSAAYPHISHYSAAYSHMPYCTVSIVCTYLMYIEAIELHLINRVILLFDPVNPPINSYAIAWIHCTLCTEKKLYPPHIEHLIEPSVNLKWTYLLHLTTFSAAYPRIFYYSAAYSRMPYYLSHLPYIYKEALEPLVILQSSYSKCLD